ncbi:hypothetical protein M407DRAFT_29739 [Tulasnella calospora MUT 4182]|uniref:BTB domain-containing protein n=1 Tax=Tulasnella calospora MUT 4182 TaxID=1051891 RepID=A0A0C3PZ01_9AGAM|nr:hypothetical protein M407DRAFT_29739 [Tulasnella calospora MUT 4182]
MQGAANLFPYSIMDEESGKHRLGVDRDGFGPAPFDESSTGDCILQSSDGTKYKTHRIVLALASTVFCDMWEVGTGGSDIPIVELTESSDVVHNLLLHLYPTTAPSIDNFSLALGLMDACDKYLIDPRGFVPHLSTILYSYKFRASEADVLDAYCLAWRLNMRESAQRSSGYLHGLELTRPGLRQEVDKKAHDVGALLALWDLRYRREVSIDAFLARLPLDLWRCPNHRELTLEETERLRQNVRKALKTPGFSFNSKISGYLDLFAAPSKISRLTKLQRMDERNPGSSSRGVRPGNPPCLACRATMNKYLRSDLDIRELLGRATVDVPRVITWPSDKPALSYL